jgi:plastocyanin
VRRGIQGSTAFGALISILIVGSVAAIGYFQVAYAPSVFAGPTATAVLTCSGSSCVNVTIPTAAATPPPNWSSTVGHVVSADFYTPPKITVVIGVNNTVQWTNDDTPEHTVTSATLPSGASSFSFLLNSGQSAVYQFTVPGTYTYFCTFHPWMGGEVIVKAGAPASSTTT